MKQLRIAYANAELSAENVIGEVNMDYDVLTIWGLRGLSTFPYTYASVPLFWFYPVRQIIFRLSLFYF